MACNRFTDLPAAGALTGAESVPLTQLGVDRKSTPPAIAVSGVNYSSTVTYPEGFIVTIGDGNYYRAEAVTTGVNPSTRNISIWTPVLFGANTTLSVPSEFATISAALDYLKYATIAENALVTISVAAGSYALTTTQLNLNHPNGERINLIGSGSGTCTLTFTAIASPPVDELLYNSGSIYVNSGNNFGLINGFTISKAGGAPAFGHCAILAFNGSINLGGGMQITGFWAQTAAAKGGVINSTSSAILTGTTASTYCTYADGGTINARNIWLETTVANTWAAGVRRGGQLLLQGADITGTDAATAFIYRVIQDGFIDDASATYGSFTNFASVDGTLQFGSNVIVSPSDTYATRSDITNFDLQSSGTVKAAVLQADTFTLGATAVTTGLQGAHATLDGAGTVTVVATWVTANTSIVVSAATAATTGPLFVGTVTPGASFVLTSTAGAADAGKVVNWIAVVYP